MLFVCFFTLLCIISYSLLLIIPLFVSMVTYDLHLPLIMFVK